MGYDPQKLEIILTQMVSLVIDGKPMMGGKRHGNVIELKEDLIDEIGKDAARFYFLLNSYETLPLWMSIWRKSSPTTIRSTMCSMLMPDCAASCAAAKSRWRPASGKRVDRSLLIHPAELDVLPQTDRLSEEVQFAAREYAPHRLTRYAIEMASR